MSDDDFRKPEPHRPRAEPEIIPPGEDLRSRRAEAYFFRFGGGDETHRIYIARPGLGSVLLGLLVLGAILAIAFLVLLGFALLLPFLLGGIAVALILGALFRGRRGY